MNTLMCKTIVAASVAAHLLGTLATRSPGAPDDNRDRRTAREPENRDRGGEGRGKGERRGGGPPGIFKTEVPARSHDIVLGRPTDDTITFSILAYADAEGYIAYGTDAGQASRKTPQEHFAGGQPSELMIASLRPNTRYYYRFHSRSPGSGAWVADEERAFHTARSPGRPFTFTITADSHLDDHTEPSLYATTVSNALADAPDFHIDMGDTFMTDKYPRYQDAAPQYLAQRYYFGLIGHSAPVYLVLGNHDGEAGRWLDGTGDNMAVWSNTLRKRYFPNPAPDDFYSGNAAKDPHAGVLQNYYSWEWGDALFVVLDPFWYCPRQKGAGDNWTRTMGREQYDWLRRVLERSRSRFRLVFIHHLVGGLDKDCRGGIEAAPFFEWGGKDPDGTEAFRSKRPGWPAPIHGILVANRVNAVFHGHDHLYAKQDLDGIVYQEIPQPGNPRANARSAKEYGYVAGEIQGGSGHLRVRVGPDRTTVEYVRAAWAADRGASHPNGSVSHGYVLRPR